MSYYVCVQLVNDVCHEWAERSDLLSLPEGSGLQIGGMLLLLSATAWGIQQIARLLLNR
ncbi:orf 58, part 2 [Pseudomonas phage Pf3]|uniref:6.4 kDa protein n=1 Tax=Pseudomonas phage Pf3 TaxID=10872 RepID=VG058_BPPF3|nr:hypothetical protein Pf3_1 [Pseudomonas phage Pf3]YP_010774588.1 hypothetical protein QJ535_gp1 [Pseudomonas phage Pf3]P03629.1 RecName: Full=6.4 kDa protein; AltName: Full=ORF 58 [Pseudomonas phage Pf3]AAA88377.1 orf 58, part 2 [Pseudomonas phage Pf3]AAA88386.1 ORF 58, part 2 [Pseudomonas phage Pf3]